MSRRKKLPLESLDNAPLSTKVANILQDAILTGKFKPGEALIEADIAHQLGVSRGPLREALQLLADRGLIDSVAYKGRKVSSLTQEDIEEVYSLRAVLETFAIRRIISIGDPQVIPELTSICQAMQRGASSNKWDVVLAEDDRFHTALMTFANHKQLMTAWLSLSLRVRQIMALRNLRNTDIMQIVCNHLPIVEAIKNCDAETATRLIEAHVASAADLMITDDLLQGNAVADKAGRRQADGS